MKKFLQSSLASALGTVIYVALVAWLMTSMDKGLGGKTIWVPIAVLLLLVLSASVTGGLVLGRPVMLYWDGKKKEAVKQFGLTIMWLFIIVVLVFSGLVMMR